MPSWLIFTLLTPFLYSITNYIEKFILEKKLKNVLGLTILFGLFSFLYIIIFFVKRTPNLSLMQISVLLISGLLLVVYLIPYFKALALDEATRVVPLFQLTPLYILVFSYILFREKLKIIQIIGFFVVLLAGFILGIEKIDRKFFKLRKSFFYMLLASFLYALVSILFKFVAIKEDFWTVIAFQGIGSGIGAILLFIFLPQKKALFYELKKLDFLSWILIIINNLFGVIANLSISYAMVLVPTAIVSVIANSTQPIFLLIESIILTMFFPFIIKEDIKKQILFIKILTIVIMFAGLFLINQ